MCIFGWRLEFACTRLKMFGRPLSIHYFVFSQCDTRMRNDEIIKLKNGKCKLKCTLHSIWCVSILLENAFFVCVFLFVSSWLRYHHFDVCNFLLTYSIHREAIDVYSWTSHLSHWPPVVELASRSSISKYTNQTNVFNRFKLVIFHWDLNILRAFNPNLI